MFSSARHRKISSGDPWQSVHAAIRERRKPGRHRKAVPRAIHTRALQALLPAATVLVLAAATAPAHATPAPTQVQTDPLAGFTQDAVASLQTLRAVAMPGVDLPGLDLPALFNPDTAIVVLGYGLLPDGSMRPELMARLYSGYVSALLSPAAPIIVTGGNPQNGVTEAQAMADWLIARGVDPARIHTETKANSTVQNAAFSAQLMNAIGVHAAILITSDDHIARALNNFQAAGISVVATLTPDASPMSATPFGPGK